MKKEKSKKQEKILPSHKFNAMLIENKGLLKGRVCLDCYREGKKNEGESDRTDPVRKDSIQESIRTGQAINLAQNEFLKDNFSPVKDKILFKVLVKEYKELIEEIQNRDK